MQRFQLLEPHLGDQKETFNRFQRVLRSPSERFSGVSLAIGGPAWPGLSRKDDEIKVRDARSLSGCAMRSRGLPLEKPALPLTSVHRQVKHFAQMIGEAAPSYWVVRDIALSIPNDLRTLAQQGARSYGELYDLVHRREESRPNALWQADHAQLDILLLREDGATARP